MAPAQDLTRHSNKRPAERYSFQQLPATAMLFAMLCTLKYKYILLNKLASASVNRLPAAEKRNYPICSLAGYPKLHREAGEVVVLRAAARFEHSAASSGQRTLVGGLAAVRLSGSLRCAPLKADQSTPEPAQLLASDHVLLASEPKSTKLAS